MRQKTKSPPARAIAGGLDHRSVIIISRKSENNVPGGDLQADLIEDLRLAWLVRRYRLPKSIAAAIVALHFGRADA